MRHKSALEAWSSTQLQQRSTGHRNLRISWLVLTLFLLPSNHPRGMWNIWYPGLADLQPQRTTSHVLRPSFVPAACLPVAALYYNLKE